MAEPQVYVLEGGIKGWVAGGPAFRSLVDGYEESYWLQIPEVKAAWKQGGEGVDTEANGGELDAKQKILPAGMMIL
jgi:hypothetical protein